MEFEWDSAKSTGNLRTRGFDFGYAARIFEGRTLEWADTRFDYGEQRIRAVGQVNDDVLVVVYTRRGQKYRIIASWKAGKKVRRQWRSCEGL